MNLALELSHRFSKSALEQMAFAIEKKPALFQELMQLVLLGDDKISPRASWLLNTCVEKDTTLLDGYAPAMIEMISKPINSSTRRNCLRLFQFAPVPEEQQGTLIDLCFSYLEDDSEEIAIRAISITILGNMISLYPDLKPEFITVLEAVKVKTTSPAIIARIKWALKPYKGI